MAVNIQKHADAQDAALAELSTLVDGVKAGIVNLDKMITEFQNSSDPVTSADQARLDKIQAATKAIVANVQALKVDVEDVPKAGAPVVIPPTDPVVPFTAPAPVSAAQAKLNAAQEKSDKAAAAIDAERNADKDANLGQK